MNSKIGRWARRAVFAMLALYVAGTGVITVFQRDFLYRPRTALVTPEEKGLTGVAMMWLTAADGIKTVGWYWPPQPGQPTLVFFHGNGGVISDRHWRIRRWAKKGFGVFLTEYRGYGGSEGRPNEEGIYADGRAALDWLKANGTPSSSLFLVGESLGSGVAVKLATERRVAGVMLEAPYTSTVDVAQLVFPMLPVRWLMWDRYDSLSRIKDIRAPLLVMHGGADTTIPQAQGRALLAAANEPKLGYFPDGAHHMDLILHGAYDQIEAFVAAHWNAPAR